MPWPLCQYYNAQLNMFLYVTIMTPLHGHDDAYISKAQSQVKQAKPSQVTSPWMQYVR